MFGVRLSERLVQTRVQVEIAGQPEDVCDLRLRRQRVAETQIGGQWISKDVLVQPPAGVGSVSSVRTNQG